MEDKIHCFNKGVTISRDNNNILFQLSCHKKNIALSSIFYINVKQVANNYRKHKFWNILLIWNGEHNIP